MKHEPSIHIPLAHKPPLTLANELERRSKKRHAIMCHIMSRGDSGETFSTICTRIGRQSQVYRDWFNACRMEHEAIVECRARFGDAVKYPSAWPGYVAKEARRRLAQQGHD